MGEGANGKPQNLNCIENYFKGRLLTAFLNNSIWAPIDVSKFSTFFPILNIYIFNPALQNIIILIHNPVEKETFT